MKQGLRQAMFAKKEKPPPPKARRSGFMRPKAHPASTELEVTRLGVPEKTHTPMDQRNEAERYEDAVEEQEEEPEQPMPLSQTTDTAPTSALPEDSAKPQPKKPPPAPRARKGWRMRKSRDNNEIEEEAKEPGKFSTNLPSVKTDITSPFSPPTEDIPETSPFSPGKEKTLDPLESTRSPTSPAPGEAKRSVSDAMNQAQAQATQQVQDCLEGTHLSESGHLHAVQEEPSNGTSKPLHPVRTSSLQFGQGSSHPESEPTPVLRVVLAPPGQAPIRGVPGPRVDVDQSPFLSDDEREEKTEDRRKLKTKDSWEDFDNDHDNDN